MSLQEVSNTVRFAELELGVLARWQRERTFQRSVERRAGAPRFVFYDGPPFATGLPHYGHILTSFIKDVVARYQTMRGYHVPRAGHARRRRVGAGDGAARARGRGRERVSHDGRRLHRISRVVLPRAPR